MLRRASRRHRRLRLACESAVNKMSQKLPSGLRHDRLDQQRILLTDKYTEETSRGIKEVSFKIDAISLFTTCFSGGSTTDARVALLKHIYNAWEKSQNAIGVLCDLSKAFDCVEHETLLQKLHYYGINGSGLDLVRPKNGRYTRINIDNPFEMFSDYLNDDKAWNQNDVDAQLNDNTIVNQTNVNNGILKRATVEFLASSSQQKTAIRTGPSFRRTD